MNRVGRGLARVGLQPVRFDPERLLEKVRRQEKLEDFGPAGYREGYEILLESLERDARLSPFGRFFAQRQLTELLAHRLRLTDYRRRHPEVASERIERPIFVVGLPRTGTTLLYGLLGADPVHRTALSWEVDDPCPPAQSERYARDPRIARTEKRFEQLRQLAPDLQVIHPIGSLMPQECIVLTASEFLSVRFEMCFDVASYQDWMMTADMAPAYAWHRRFLEHMQSGLRRERWVLKSPGHLGPIDALLAEYPDALIVQTHRDPRKIIPSVASLEYTLRCISTDEQDAARLGEQQLRQWSRQLQSGIDARDRLPQHAAQILDLHFADLTADPLSCVARIYDHFGIGLTAKAEAAMRAYLDENPREKYGAHRYSLEMFGIDPDRVDGAFKGYCERFGVAREQG